MGTLYATLGVSAGSSASEIKRSYRRLALRYHPDRNGGDAACAERFKDLNRAYETLSNEHLRQSYDLELKADRPQRPATMDPRRRSRAHDPLYQEFMAMHAEATGPVRRRAVLWKQAAKVAGCLLAVSICVGSATCRALVFGSLLFLAEFCLFPLFVWRYLRWRKTI